MSEKNIYSKLAKVKSSLKIAKDAENDYAGYKYATLDVILAELNPLLENNGLSFDIINYEDNHPSYNIKAVLSDIDSDKVIEYSYTINGVVTTTKGKGESIDNFVYKIQDAGSAITYCTRYVYGTVFAIPFQEDNIQKNTGNKEYKASTEWNATNTVWLASDQYNKLVTMAKANDNTDAVKAMVKKYSGTVIDGVKYNMKREYKENLKKYV